ncbi:MAG: Ig-like domain-containing protein [Gemmatimonadaceae bacterium]
MRLQKTLLVVTAMGIISIASSCRDIVAPTPVTTISLSDISAELVPQETQQFAATPKDASGLALTRPVSWTTSAPGIATVDNGLVTAKNIGTATITATSEGVRADVSVVVSDGGIALPSGNLIVGLGGQVKLDVPSAAVSQSGRIIIAQALVAPASTRLIPGTAVSLRTQAPLAQAALLIIRYDPAQIAGSPESGLRLYQATPSAWLPVAGSWVDLTTKTVQGKITGSGVYAIFAQASVASVSVGPSAPGIRVGDVATFTAVARDDDSNQLDNRVTTWTSSAPDVVRIDASTGVAQAKSPGSATVKATIEGVSASTTVSVTPGSAANISIAGGDGQSADTSSAVAIAPSVKVTDAAGFAVSGATVTFAVASGGGSISPTAATTDAAGIASADKWTLGKPAGPNSVTASIAGGASVTISATATQPAAQAPPAPPPPAPPAPPASPPVTPPTPQPTPTTIAIFAGDGQTAPALSALPVRPAVKVTAANGAPVRDVVVTFSIRSGGGSITGETATTDSAGIATIGSWIVGAGGGNSLFATRSGLSGSPLIFVATATVGSPGSPPPPPPLPPPQLSGPPVTMAIYAGEGQSAAVGAPVPVSPAVLVTDAAGVPVNGVSVTFSVRSGGGTIIGEVATTNSLGVATLGRWTLGDVGGNSLFATRSGLNGSPLIFTAVATAGVRIVTFGDSNTDAGWAGTNPIAVATSYVSVEGPYAGPNTHSPTQLAGKLESTWKALSAVSIAAVNHGISGTWTGSGRTGSGAPNARETVAGVTRFAGEVLGAAYPWDGGETGPYFPNGSVKRVAAFVPGPNDFVYVSLGTNDPTGGLTSQETAINLNWMIDQWIGAGHQADHFILTTLAPRPSTNGAIVLINQQIRLIATSRSVYLVDIAGRTSDDNGGTWRSSADHIGDFLHYSEPVRDWIATQVVSYMRTKAPI